jgi:hypothetical protein
MILAPVTPQRVTRRQHKQIHGRDQVTLLCYHSLRTRCTHLVVKEPKPNQQSSSWLSRWWNKEGSSAPIKATLGEESSFVYDKELKRWVNKKVGFDPRYASFPVSVISTGWCRGRKTRGPSSATFPSSNRFSEPLCSEDTKWILFSTSTRTRSFGR